MLVPSLIIYGLIAGLPLDPATALSWTLHASRAWVLPMGVAEHDRALGEEASGPAVVDHGAPSVDPSVDEPAEGLQDPVGDLLDVLERSGDDLHTFTASVIYEVEDALLGDTVIRQGRIVYRVDPETRARSFAILFDFKVENRRKIEKSKHYVFSGRWLAEIDRDQKLFIKHEVAPEGREIDPLKLGEGPFPLPIGQKRRDVEDRFDASLLPTPVSGLLGRLKDRGEVDGLLLKPRADTAAAKDIERIELFYDRATHLPVGVSLIERNGDRKTALLSDLRRNPDLTDAETAALSVETPTGADWEVDVRLLEKSE
jgi:hypothetical protein